MLSSDNKWANFEEKPFPVPRSGGLKSSFGTIYTKSVGSMLFSILSQMNR